MLNDTQLSLLGDPSAADRMTESGKILPCHCGGKCFDDSALHACETQLELEKKARLEAEARAEKAERERDECKAKYCAKEPCTTCIHYEEKDCDGDCLSCTADCPCNKCEEYSMWAWNGQKEE